MAETILQTIAEYARLRVKEAKRSIPLEEMKQKAFAERDRQRRGGRADFRFEEALREPGIRFICECKKASPSRGMIAEEFPYVEIARSYEEAGAACISVLTEPRWFLGENRYLEEIGRAVTIPCLRKDFTVDEYMLYEAKALGASAALLICSLLNEGTLKRYMGICGELGMSALVEAHDEGEIAMALAAGARVIGVNNRNLKDFTVDLGNCARLRRLVPEEVLFVAESGIRSPEEVRELKEMGVNGVLIGEALMRAKDKKAMLKELRSEKSGDPAGTGGRNSAGDETGDGEHGSSN